MYYAFPRSRGGLTSNENLLACQSRCLVANKYDGILQTLSPRDMQLGITAGQMQSLFGTSVSLSEIDEFAFRIENASVKSEIGFQSSSFSGGSMVPTRIHEAINKYCGSGRTRVICHHHSFRTVEIKPQVLQQ